MKEAGKQPVHSKRRFWLPALFCVLATDLIALISNISDAGVGDWLHFTFHPVGNDDGGIYLILMYVLMKVVGHENVATGFSVVHNKDGSIKHREDGSIVEDIEYERQEIRGLGLNYAILLCPIILIGSTSYFFHKKKAKDDIQM